MLVPNISIGGYSIGQINNLKSSDHYIKNEEGNYLVSYRFRYVKYAVSEITLLFRRLFNFIKTAGTWETDHNLLKHVIVEINKNIAESKKPNPINEFKKDILQKKHNTLLAIKNDLLAHVTGRVLAYTENHELFPSTSSSNSSTLQTLQETINQLNQSLSRERAQQSPNTLAIQSLQETIRRLEENLNLATANQSHHTTTVDTLQATIRQLEEDLRRARANPIPDISTAENIRKIQQLEEDLRRADAEILRLQAQGTTTQPSTSGESSTNNRPKRIVGVYFNNEAQIMKYCHTEIKSRFPNIEFRETPLPDGQKFKVSFFYISPSTHNISGFMEDAIKNRALSESECTVLLVPRNIKYDAIPTDPDCVSRLKFARGFNFCVMNNKFVHPETNACNNEAVVEELRSFIEPKFAN